MNNFLLKILYSCQIWYPYLTPVPNIEQNSDVGIFSFWILVEHLLKKNGNNSGNSNDIKIKLEPLTELDKGNKATTKKFDDDFMSTNFDVSV